jgi:hypothetical protein
MMVVIMSHPPILPALAGLHRTHPPYRLPLNEEVVLRATQGVEAGVHPALIEAAALPEKGTQRR